jgi:HK97 family phage prohead protease
MTYNIQKPIKMDFSIKVEAADFPKRELSGRIVTWNETGVTSSGSTMFQKGSITFSKSTKLLLEHRREAPIGFLKDYTEDDEGIYATFSIGNTTAGSDALVEASTGLRDGFSVGVIAQKYKNVDGVLVVSASALKEVSLVTDPAIASAKVEIAASENENSESEPEADEQPTEGDKQVETPTAVPEVAADTVEASKVEKVEASRPLYFSSPRSPITTGGAYLEHTIKAGLGNEDSRQYIKAADDSFTTNPAFSPVSYVRDVAQNTNADRPVIDACGGTRPLNSYGMTVSIPKITANSTAATVAEGGDPTGTTAITSSYVNATVIKKAGFQRYSVELLDRSDPSFYEIMLQNLRDAYAQATDAYVIAQITAGGTQATAKTQTQLALLALYQQKHQLLTQRQSAQQSHLFQVLLFGVYFLAQPMTTGRPIYNAGNPMNNAGSAIPTSIRGNVLGLDYYVDPNMVSTSIDESAFIIEPRSIEIFESPALTLATNVPTTGEIEIMLYGYIAAQATFAGGLRRFNLT